MSRDQELGMDRPITRRDFLDGVAVAAGGASLLAGNAGAATSFPQDRPGYDPPTLTGMRGSHDGSYAYAHALRDGNFWKSAGRPWIQERRTIWWWWGRHQQLGGRIFLPRPNKSRREDSHHRQSRRFGRPRQAQ